MRTEIQKLLDHHRYSHAVSLKRNRVFYDELEQLKFDISAVEAPIANLILDAFTVTAENPGDDVSVTLIHALIDAFEAGASDDAQPIDDLPAKLAALVPSIECIACFEGLTSRVFLLDAETGSVFECKSGERKRYKTFDSIDAFLEQIDFLYKHDGSCFALKYFDHIHPDNITDEHLQIREIFTQSRAFFNYKGSRLAFGESGCNDARKLNEEGWFPDGFESLVEEMGNPRDYFVLGGQDEYDWGNVYFACLSESPMTVYSCTPNSSRASKVSSLADFLAESSLKMPKSVTPMESIDQLLGLTPDEVCCFAEVVYDSEMVHVAERFGDKLLIRVDRSECIESFASVAAAEAAFQAQQAKWQDELEPYNPDIRLQVRKGVEACVAEQLPELEIDVETEAELALVMALTHLKRLKLTSFKVPLPVDLSNFSALESLTLRLHKEGVDADGKAYFLPPSIGQLKQLKTLDFHSHGSLADEIGDLENLTSLCLRHVDVTDGLTRLKQLTELEYECGDIHELPDVFGRISSLESLRVRVGWDRRPVALPASYTTLSNLKRLDLNGVFVNTVPESIIELTALEHLNISRGHGKEKVLLDAPLPDALFTMSLKSLSLQRVPLPDNVDILCLLRDMGDVLDQQRLVVANVPEPVCERGIGAIVDYLAPEKAGKTIVRYGHFEGHGYEEICQITIEPDAGAFMVSTALGRDRQHEKGSAKVKQQQFATAELAEQQVQKQLKAIEKKGFVPYCPDFGVEKRYHLDRCKAILAPAIDYHVNYNEKVFDFILTELTHLRGFALDDEILSNVGDRILGLENLKTLSINSKRSLRELPEFLGEFSHLERPKISTQTYEDEQVLPQWVTRLKALKVLELNAGNLMLPPEFGDLHALEYFSAGYNDVANIPAEIGNLKQLRYFGADDLKSNTLPVELVGLPNLSRLNISASGFDDIPDYHQNMEGLFQSFGLVDKKIFSGEAASDEEVRTVSLPSYCGYHSENYVKAYLLGESDVVPVLGDMGNLYSSGGLLRSLNLSRDGWSAVEKRIFAIITHSLWYGKTYSSGSSSVSGFGMKLFSRLQNDDVSMKLFSRLQNDDVSIQFPELLALLLAEGLSRQDVVKAMVNAISEYEDDGKVNAMGQFVLEEFVAEPEFVIKSMCNERPAIALLKLIHQEGKLELTEPYLAHLFSYGEAGPAAYFDIYLQADKERYAEPILTAFRLLDSKYIYGVSVIIHNHFGDAQNALLAEYMVDGYHGAKYPSAYIDWYVKNVTVGAKDFLTNVLINEWDNIDFDLCYTLIGAGWSEDFSDYLAHPFTHIDDLGGFEYKQERLRKLAKGSDNLKLYYDAAWRITRKKIKEKRDRDRILKKLAKDNDDYCRKVAVKLLSAKGIGARDAAFTYFSYLNNAAAEEAVAGVVDAEPDADLQAAMRKFLS